MAHMDKQSKSQRKLRGKEKQSSLEQSFSRSQRKGKQRVPASATSVASGPSSTPSTKPVVIDLEDDPYVFTDSESHKIEPPVVEHTVTPSRKVPRPPLTPSISRKSTPRPMKSPAVKMEEELMKREEEELKKALEESRKELEREKRRRRYERREMQAEVEEQPKLPSEFHKHETPLAKETGASNQTFTRHDSASSEDVLLKPVLQQGESVREPTSSQSASRDSTSPMVPGPRSSLSLKAVTVKRLSIYSLQSLKKCSVSQKLGSSEEENEKAIHPTEVLSISKEQQDEDDKFSQQNETPELEETDTILKSYQGDDTPPLSNEASNQGTEQQSGALQTTPPDQSGSDDFSEPIDSTGMEAESELCVTKQSESAIGVESRELEEASVSSGDTTEMDVEAEGGSTPVREEEEHAQQPERTSELGKPMALKTLTDVPVAHEEENEDRKTPATEDVPEVERSVTPDTKSLSSHLSLKRARTNSKPSLFKETKDPQPPQAKKLKFEDNTSEKPQAKTQAVIRKQSEQDPSKTKMIATVCEAEKCETASPRTSTRSLLPSVEPSVELFKETKDSQPPQAKKLKLEDNTSKRPQAEMQAVIRKQSEQDPSSDLKTKTSATVCEAEKCETASPRTSTRSLLPSVEPSVEPKQLRAQAASVLASHKISKTTTLNRGSSKPPIPLCTPGDTLTTECIVRCFDDYNAQLWHAQSQVIYRIKWGEPIVSHSKQSPTTLDFKPKRRSTRGPRAKHASTGYSLDISSFLASKVESPVLPGASKTTTPSDGESSPQQISSAVIQEGQVDEPLKTTPSRQRLSLGRRALNTSKASHQGAVSNVPSERKQPSRTSVNATRASTSLFGEGRLYDFSDSDDDLTPPREGETAGHMRAHTSSSLYRSPPRIDDKPTSQPSQTSPFRSKLVPTDKNQPEHSDTHEGVSTDTTNRLEAPTRSKRPAISPAPSEEEWISSRPGRKPSGPASSRTSKVRKPMLRVTATRSHKRARLLDDSSGSDGAGNSPDGESTNHSRKQPQSKRPASVIRDSHSPEISNTECNPEKDGDDVSTVSSGHSSDSSLPPSFLLYAGSSKGKRQKRDGKPKETPKDKPAESVIDLTKDSQLQQEVEPIPNPPSPLQQVPCPLCSKMFDRSLIEEHAAQCEGGSGSEEESTSGHSSSVQTLRPSSSKPPSKIQEEDEDEEWSSAEQEDNQHFSGGSESDDGGMDQTTEDRRSQTEPKVFRSEDGGFYVDPSTVSKSPLRTFTRIGDLDPRESDMYYNQFTRKSKRKSKAEQTHSGPFTVGSNWGRADFDDLLSGGGERGSERRYDPSKSYHSKWRRGRGGGGRGGRGGAGGRERRGRARGREGRGERRGKQQKGRGRKT